MDTLPEKANKDKTCQWLSKSDSISGTKLLLCAAQEQTIRTNYVKHKSIRIVKAPSVDYVGRKVKVCKISKWMWEVASERSNENVAKKVHWELCKNKNFI